MLSHQAFFDPPEPLHLDWETRSTLDLRDVGVHKYARHPDTDIWCAQYAIGDGEVKLWTPDQPCPPEITAHVARGGEVAAHNYEFEHEIGNHIAHARYGWPEFRAENATCTMALALAMALPASLDGAAKALRLPFRKDAAGHALMLRMARPRSKKGVRPLVWWDEPEKLQALYAYCKQDVIVERELHKHLRPLSPAERRVWQVHFAINSRGVRCDTQSAAAAVKVAKLAVAACNAELRAITSDAVPAVTNVAKLTAWVAEQGVPVGSLAKRDVIDLLADRQGLPPNVARALELRQEAGKASTAKFERMLEAAIDERLYGVYVYHKAAPGRFASRGTQVHNLVRDMPAQQIIRAVHSLLRGGDANGAERAIASLFGPPLAVLARSMRSFFVPAEGRVLVGGDFANVEGRGQAWFSGEQWKLDAFVASDEKRGPGMYELAYARMFGVPVESVKNPSDERQIGKVSELAFAYGGGAGSFRTMGRNYNVTVSDAKADEFKHAWRFAHPRISDYRSSSGWYALERAVCAAVLFPGAVYKAGHPGREAQFRVVGSFLWCLLPSGRAIAYPYPKLMPGMYGDQLTYMCVPSANDLASRNIIDDPENSGDWCRISTYGGALLNNVVQGFCRDLLTHAILEAETDGLPVVLHTHDDLNVEVPRANAAPARLVLQKIMRTPPAWAKGFPLFAKCGIMDRYGKE